MWDCVTITGDDNCTLNILSKSYEELLSMSGNKGHKLDVCALSHIKNIGVEWLPRTVTESDYGEYEDNYFLDRIKPINFIPVTTVLKIAFAGFKRSNTNGNDQTYYNLLMNKLKKDKKTLSGWILDSDTPYVYPEFKDTLYNKSNKQ